MPDTLNDPTHARNTGRSRGSQQALYLVRSSGPQLLQPLDLLAQTPNAGSRASEQGTRWAVEWCRRKHAAAASYPTQRAAVGHVLRSADGRCDVGAT